MKRFLSPVVLCGLALSAGCAAPVVAEPVTIDNGTQMGNVQAHNGSMIRVGDYYYWVGTSLVGADESKSFSFSIYRSSDLKNWTFRNRILTRENNPTLPKGQGARARILWNSQTQRYVLWCKWLNYNDRSFHNAVVAQCDTIDGDYKFVRSFRPEGNRTADCSLFKDDDGTGYFIANGQGDTPKNMNIYKLTPDYLNVEKTVAILPWQREGPALFKRNGVYFLVTSGRSGWKPNQQKYVTARNLTGPWSELKNVGGPKAYDGQTTFVQPVSGSQTTSYLWMSDVWRQPTGGTYTDSDYKWLPLSFPDDTTLELKDAKQIAVDVETGVVARVP